MLNLLLIIMFVFVLIKREHNIKMVVFLFVFEKCYSQIMFLFLEQLVARPVGIYYYLPMAILDFLTILVLSNLARTPRITIELQRICLVSIFANLAAWLCWELYIDHAIVYNWFYVLLYIYSIFIIIKRKNKNDRDHRIDLWARYFRFHSY